MKRFFKEAMVENGAVLLDGKGLNTPAKNKVVLPNDALAQLIADEWNAVGDKIDKNKLPLTGMASLAIDIALPRRNELIVELLEYGETDLMFYHAMDEDLSAEQRLKWQPWLNRAQVEFGTRYEVTNSIMPVAQADENKVKHVELLDTLDQWNLALLAAVVKPSTSLLLGWYFIQNELDDAKLFDLSRLEETFNMQKWGEQYEAKEKAEDIRADLAISALWRSLL
ncbi:MAG: ATP12 family protein [Rickettsiales bacterium]|nr:ATP12 family protein [Rickettsiales bacterium]